MQVQVNTVNQLIIKKKDAWWGCVWILERRLWPLLVKREVQLWLYETLWDLKAVYHTSYTAQHVRKCFLKLSTSTKYGKKKINVWHVNTITHMLIRVWICYWEKCNEKCVQWVWSYSVLRAKTSKVNCAKVRQVELVRVMWLVQKSPSSLDVLVCLVFPCSPPDIS